MKFWINIVSWILLAAALIAALAFSSHTHRRQQCRSFNVAIDYGRHTSGYLISAEEVKQHLFHAIDTPMGKTYDCIDIEVYEKTLMTIPYIGSAQVWLSVDGHLTAKVVQREPLLRICDNSGASFYLDMEGIRMPLSTHHSAHVMIAAGAVDDSLSRSWDRPLADAGEEMQEAGLYKAFIVARHLQKDDFLSALVSQIYVESNGEIQLIPRLGRQLIILGDTRELPQRLEKLRKFYEHGITRSGWEKYGVINIKYSNQVICTLK